MYKKENTKRLKNFPAGYVGSFYRNLADNINTDSDFYSRIAADADIPEEDVQKCILATSDFAKSIQTNINHYVTQDRINDASFRQKLDPISKNILRRQNPLELVFEDISKFDAENPIVGSLLREIDINKKQSDSDFIKSLPSHPGKEFEIQKRLNRLCRKTFFNNNNNNNNGNNNNNSNDPGGAAGPSLFENNILGEPPSLPQIEDFLDGGPRPPQPPQSTGNFGKSLFESNNSFLPPQNNLTSFSATHPILRSTPNFTSSKGIGNDLFGSQAATTVRENKTKTQQEVDDFLYELPDSMPELVLGDGLLNCLGTEVEDLFNSDAPPSKKEEKDEILKDIMSEYEIDKIRDTMDEKGEIPESIYFLYGGDSDQFNNALEFIGLSPINREFGAFLMYDLGWKTVTQNKLSIHVDSGDIFYENHNTGEKLYSFLLSQQNDEAAYVPKEISYRDSFESYISSFLKNFSIVDQEKFDLLAFKNSKYLFYRFNDFIKAYGNPRYKLLDSREMLDTVRMKKIEERNKQFLIEKVIHGVEFEDLYKTEPEKKPEIMSTIERNYRILRRVYQQLHIDTAEMFAEFISSLNSYEIHDMDEDIKAIGWGIKKITEVTGAQELLILFPDFYAITGRLPL